MMIIRTGILSSFIAVNLAQPFAVVLQLCFGSKTAILLSCRTRNIIITCFRQSLVLQIYIRQVRIISIKGIFLSKTTLAQLTFHSATKSVCRIQSNFLTSICMSLLNFLCRTRFRQWTQVIRWIWIWPRVEVFRNVVRIVPFELSPSQILKLLM